MMPPAPDIWIPTPRRHAGPESAAAVRPLPASLAASHLPYVRNGEAELARLLRRLGIAYEYESKYYALRYAVSNPDRIRDGGFVPDFFLPATATRPALNLELTFADRGLPSMSREQYQANLERLELKRLKVRLTRRHYGIQTVLITSNVFLEIRRDARCLERLIRRAAIRHGRDWRRTRAAA